MTVKGRVQEVKLTYPPASYHTLVLMSESDRMPVDTIKISITIPLQWAKPWEGRCVEVFCHNLRQQGRHEYTAEGIKMCFGQKALQLQGKDSHLDTAEK